MKVAIDLSAERLTGPAVPASFDQLNGAQQLSN